MKKKLLLLGGGGHFHSVLDSIIRLNRYEEIGVVDHHFSTYMGISAVGTDEDLPQLINAGWNEAFISVGSIGDTTVRRNLYSYVKKIGYNIPSIVDPSAILGKGVQISEGAFVGKNAIVNIGSGIGVCSIINTGAILDHDCNIGDFSHISPGVTLCGQVVIGDDSHIGAGSVVRQSITIGSNTLIGVGSVVVGDIPNDVKAFGNPCRVVNK